MKGELKKVYDVWFKVLELLGEILLEILQNMLIEDIIILEVE